MRWATLGLVGVVTLGAAGGCGGTRRGAADARRDDLLVGNATWYGRALAGHRMANGAPFDPRRMTAAHRTLPLGTWVEVTRVDTGERVRVRITDRGPYGHPDRVIDLSRAAAAKLSMLRAGIVPVEIRVVAGP